MIGRQIKGRSETAYIYYKSDGGRSGRIHIRRIKSEPRRAAPSSGASAAYASAPSIPSVYPHSAISSVPETDSSAQARTRSLLACVCEDSRVQRGVEASWTEVDRSMIHAARRTPCSACVWSAVSACVLWTARHTPSAPSRPTDTPPRHAPI